MKLYKLNSNKQINVNISKYRIDWKKYPSKEQKVLQDFLYPYWKNSVVLSEFRVPGSLLRIDLINVNKRLCIEYSPESHHGNYNEFFHKNKSNYMQSIMRDYCKYEWTIKNGFTLLELNEEDLNYLSYDYFVKKYNVYL